MDAVFFALTGLALLVLRARGAPADRGPRWVAAAAVAFAALELLAIAGSVMQQDARRVALSGLGWIGAATVVWLVWFRRERPGSETAARSV